MTLKLHNTLTGKAEEFKPEEKGIVKMYSCGPTVYDYPHVGNWFGYVVWDILVRLLKNNYEVERVINITDVGHLTGDNDGDADRGEDKLSQTAKKQSKTAWEIAEFYTNNFIEQIDNLGLVKPKYIAKATDYIDQQLELILMLKEKGFTYQIDDGIYFDTSKFKSYADFAHLDLAEQRAGARVEFNPEKRNHSDFALWKFSPVDEKRDMEWETPLELLERDGTSEPNDGNKEISGLMGFPGWHIECSAMVMSLLGETIDIHTGGIDHIPVHHTNEIAQSQAATGKTLSNFWLHNNHLKVEGTKISKSLGNGYTLEDLETKGFSAQDYRMFVLQTHYRSEGNFSFENLTSAKNRLTNWRNIATLRHQTHDTIENDDDKSKNDSGLSLYATSQAVIEALEDDINTPKALATIDEAFSRVTNAKLSDIHRDALMQLLELIEDSLGLQLLKTTPDISDDNKQLIIQRNHARASQDWKKADSIRKELAKNNIALRDNINDVIWEYSS